MTYWLLSLLQLVYPYDFRLTEKEVITIFFLSFSLVLKMLSSNDGGFLTVCFCLLQKTSICYLSFPDSYSGR